MSITDKQIEQLRTEAGAAGDEDMVETCNLALIGDPKARRECAEAIEAGSVMIDWGRFED